MNKKERVLVFTVGAILLLIFTFTDLPISMALATKPLPARILEVIGEVPFTLLAMSAFALIIRFRSRQSVVKKIIAVIGGAAGFVCLDLLGAFMTLNYIRHSFGETSGNWLYVLAALFALLAILLSRAVPEENREEALRYAAAALVYFLLVMLVMNVLKILWSRMRFREMTDPLTQFTPWYHIGFRGGFDDAFASFPSGHAMNSAGMMLITLLPYLIPSLKDKKKVLKAAAYIWCLVIGYSRIFMGAHFASDVTIGLMLSLALFDLTSRLLFYKK